MPTLDALLQGVLLPAGAAGVLLVLGRLPLLGWAGTSLAVGGAYLAGHVGLRGWRGWVPQESTDRIAVIVAIATALSLLGLTRRALFLVRVLLHVGIGAGAAWYLAGAYYQREAGLPGAGVQVGLAGVAAALIWWCLEREAPNAPATDARGGAIESALLALAAGGAAVAIGLSGSQLLAQLMGALAAALAGAAVAGRVLGALPPLPRSAPPIALGYVALLVAATAFADLPRETAGLLALAPLAAPGAARGGFVARLVVLVALLGAGTWAAWDASPSFEGL